MLHHVTCVDYAAVVCKWLACLSTIVLARLVRFTCRFIDIWSLVSGLLAVIGSITVLSVLILGVIAALFVRR